MSLSNDKTLELVLAPIPGEALTAHRLPLRIVFVNDATEPVRILDRFEPLQVFFSFQIVRADGTPLSTAGGGKVDFGPEPLGYVELRPGESHSIDVDTAGLLSEALAPGDYSISATYHNQYGERCFRGALESDPITISVGAGDAERGP
jgi:hypothetical protein